MVFVAHSLITASVRSTLYVEGFMYIRKSGDKEVAAPTILRKCELKQSKTLGFKPGQVRSSLIFCPAPYQWATNI